MMPWHRAAPSRTGRAPTVGGVGRQAGLVGQVVLPGDVAGVMVVDHDRPLLHGQLGHLGVHRGVGLDDAVRVVAAEHVGAGVGGVGQDPEHPGVGEPSPAQLAGPHPAIGAQRESSPLERRHDLIGRPAGTERGEEVSDRSLRPPRRGR